jgi:hypothetical protein
MNIVYQGEIALDGSTIIKAENILITITNIIINNTSSAYTITVNRNLDSEKQITLLYTFSLDQGDTVRDTQLYALDPGDYIQLISNVAGTTYYINSH